MKRIIAIAITVFLALAMLAGCSAGKSANDSSGWSEENSGWGGGSAVAPQAPATDQAADYDKGLTGGEIADYESQRLTDEMYGGRKVIRTYDFDLQTDDFDNVLAAIQQRLSDYNGYSLNTSISGRKPTVYGDSGRTANMTLRVPAEKAEDFVKGVQGLGTLMNFQDYTDDITDQYFDTDARLQVLKAELERLQSILVKTDNLADVIALEDRISSVMLEIEQLTGTLKKYDALVDFSTVVITLYEEALIEGPAATKTTGERIAQGFTDSLYGVGTFFTNLFVWFVSSLPVLVVLAVVALAVILIVRACGRRSANRRAAEAAKAAVRQQALFEKEKAAYLAQQKAEQNQDNASETKEDAGNEVR
ncbi:MAG TPA: DUF4349 domain-containing protein [Clostridia bacterium]|jgi:hypothetical protein|nr:DUF4349 domain-containing protein [Clostridia bacterium]